MKIDRLCSTALFLVACVATPAMAAAEPIWSWAFDETLHVVGSSEAIILEATLFNSPQSTEPVTEVGGASFTGDLQKIYAFTFGPTGNSLDFRDQFAGMHVSPGASFSFVLGILTPIGGVAPNGLHPFCCETAIAIGNEGGVTLQGPENTFAVQVAEPSVAVLLGIGIALGVFLRR